MAIKRISGNRYTIRVTLTQSGLRREKKFTGEFQTIGQAKRKEREMMLSLDLPEEARVLTWKLALEQYLKNAQLNLKSNTLYNREKVLGLWTSSWKEKPLVDIKFEDIETLFRSLKTTSYTYQNDVRKYLNCVFNFHLNSGSIVINPCKNFKVRTEKNSSSSAKKLEAISVEEIQKLLSFLEVYDRDWYAIVFVTYMLGLRSGEAQALYFEDVDFQRNIIHITKSWDKREVKTTPPKNGASRIVPMNEKLKSFLWELSQEGTAKGFILPRVNAWMNGTGSIEIKKFQRAAGVKETNFHSIRASFITHLLLRGVNVIKVQIMVGHSDLKTTQRYIRLSGSDLGSATDVLIF